MVFAKIPSLPVWWSSFLDIPLSNYALIFLLLSKGQLWGLLVTSAIGPGPWTEEGTNEGKLV